MLEDEIKYTLMHGTDIYNSHSDIIDSLDQKTLKVMYAHPDVKVISKDLEGLRYMLEEFTYLYSRVERYVKEQHLEQLIELVKVFDELNKCFEGLKYLKSVDYDSIRSNYRPLL